MRTHVTFQADFAKDAGAAEPAGRDLARYLASRLDAAEFAAAEPEIHEGYAYTFACRRGKRMFVVFVALVDDGVQEWLVYVEPKASAVTRWMQNIGVGRSRNTDTPELQDLCAAIHQCLRDDQRFQSVRWYTTEGWDTDPDTGWTRTP